MIETKKQNYIDGSTKGVTKGPRLCVVFEQSRIISISFIDCKNKVFFSFQNYVTVSIDFHFLIKPNIKQFNVLSMVYLNLVLI